MPCAKRPPTRVDGPRAPPVGRSVRERTTTRAHGAGPTSVPTEPQKSITDRVRLCLDAHTYIENVTKPIPVDLVVVVGS
jgi:hypothetical protein